MKKFLLFIFISVLADSKLYARCTEWIHKGTIGGMVSAKCINARNEGDVGRKSRAALKRNLKKYCDNEFGGNLRVNEAHFINCNDGQKRCQKIEAKCCAFTYDGSKKCKKN